MFKYLRIAFRNVIANKRRSLFIGIAIAVGTIIMIVTASLSNGLRDNMIKNSFALFTGYVNIYGTDTIRGQRIMRINNVEPINKIINEIMPSDSTVLYRTGTGGKLFNPNKNVPFQRCMLLGMDIDKETLFTESVTVIDGDIYSILDNNYALIELETSKKFDFQVGDVLSFEGLVESKKYGIAYNTADFTVGGIIQGMPMGGFGSIIRISNSAAKNFSSLDDNQSGRISIFTDNKYDSTMYAEKIEEALVDAGFRIKKSKSRSKEEGDSKTQSFFEDFDAEFKAEKKKEGLEIRVRTWQEEISFMEEMIKTIEAVALVLNTILMAIILLGISNTLVMAIRERTGEIGTLRAIGMQKSSILLLFILEGIILGILGSIVGLIIGGGISLFLSIYGWYIGPSPISIFLLNNTLYFKITLDLILSVIISIVIVATLASLYPSYQATKLKPVTAMQKE